MDFEEKDTSGSQHMAALVYGFVARPDKDSAVTD